MDEKKEAPKDDQELEQTFEVAELEDEDLEDVAGGHNGNCGCVPK